MKRKLLIVIIGAGAIWLVSVFTRPNAPIPMERIAFVGFTNGVTGTFVGAFGATTTNHGAVIDAWLAAGTNGAVFTVTNGHPLALRLHPIVIFKEKRGLQQESPFLGTITLLSTMVSPGQVATVQVAVLPHKGPWKLQLSYFEVPRYPWLRPYLDWLDPHRYTVGAEMESGWIEP